MFSLEHLFNTAQLLLSFNTYLLHSWGHFRLHAMPFFPIFFFLTFVAFVIKAGEFAYLLRETFFFFQIWFNRIFKTAIIYLVI